MECRPSLSSVVLFVFGVLASAGAWPATPVAAVSSPDAATGADVATAADGDHSAAAGGRFEDEQQIVVTATKQAETLGKVPISISAYTRESMDDRDMRSIADIAAQTPGVDLGDQGANGVGDRIAIRGIDSNTASSTTGVYIDDIPIQARNNPVNLGGTTFPEIFDLERVEVLRGPQGTLFGAGAEGGVVRFITPTPSLTQDSTYARAEFGTTQGGGPSYEAGAAFGGPLVNNVLGLRISAWGRQDGGWVDRRSWETGQQFDDVNWTDSGTARIALLWQPQEDVQIQPSVMFQGVHENDSPNYWAVLSDPSRSQFVSGAALRQPSTDHFVLPSLKVAVQLQGMQLTSITSYFYRSETNVYDATNTDIAGVSVLSAPGGGPDFYPQVASGTPVIDQFDGATWQNIFTQELRLQSTDAAAPVRWVTGAFFQNSRLNDTQLVPNPQLGTLFSEQGQSFADYYYDSSCVNHCSGLLDGIYEYVGNEHSRDMQVALFGNADWSITRRWIVNAGLRIERTRDDYVAVEDGPDNDGTSSGGGGVTATPVTPKLGLSYQYDENNLYYASIAKGYRPGGGNSHVPTSCSADTSALGLTQAPTQYSSDSTLSYELGSKNSVAGGLLSVDASIYYIDWRNIQWYYVLPDCGYGFVLNLGRARSTGFDLDLNGRLTSRLRAELSVGYTDASFLDTIVLDPASGAQVVGAGQTLGQTPWTMYGSLDYRFTQLAHAGWYARITDDFKSRNSGPFLYQNPSSAVYDPELQPNPSMNQMDVRLGREWSGMDLSLFVNNVLDAAPVIEANHFIGSPIFMDASLRPRTIGLTGTLHL